MATQKVRFTLWMDPDVLRAAKLRAAEEGVTSSQVIAAAARTALIDSPKDAEARIVQAVERVFTLIQRNDRRRTYDQQVLKEMVGLLVQSFFNHTPAIPDKDKKLALHSGKARFNRFLDTLAANLRGGQSILNDLPASHEPPDGVEAKIDSAQPKVDLPVGGDGEASAAATEPIPPPEQPSPQHSRREKSQPAETRSRWNLFG